jgi:hypothetical protein
VHRFVVSVVAVGFLVVAGSLLVGGSTSVDKVLLLTAADRTDPQLRETITGFAAAGYYVTDRPDAALRAARSANLSVFMATRRTLHSVPETAWSELYGRDVVIGGINVSLLELNPVVAGSGRLRYTPDRAIFSFAYWSSDCGNGATSDWLDNWNLPGIISMRVEQIRACAAQ